MRLHSHSLALRKVQGRMLISCRRNHLDSPRPVSAPAGCANCHQAIQSSRRRNDMRDRADAPRDTRREIGGNYGASDGMRCAREQSRPRRMDDGNRDAGVHEGEQKQGVRPHLVGRDRLVQARKEAPGFEGVSDPCPKSWHRSVVSLTELAPSSNASLSSICSGDH